MDKQLGKQPLSIHTDYLLSVYLEFIEECAMTLNRGINKLMDAREGTKLSISVSSGTKGKISRG